MSKRFDNKKLFVILAGLLAVMLLTFIFKIPKERSTLMGNLVEIDTAKVARIMVIPKIATGKPFEFIRENNLWRVSQENITSTPREGAIENIFTEVLAIKPQSLAAVGEPKFKEYELTDSLATRLKFLNSRDKIMADIMIGSFTYKQVQNPYGGYGGNNIEGTSFVRLYDKDDIYAVSGFLAFSFGGGFDDWRDRTFLKCKKEDITKITFTYPADSSFVLEKIDSVWYAGSQTADSLKTSDYLNSVGMLEGADFRDGYKPSGSPEYQMVIEGNNLDIYIR